jgi:hypothetical protein
MQRKDEQSELLFQLLQKEGTDVIHLPYTPAFENVCSALSKKPSIEDKHKLWERVLELQSHSQAEKPPTVAAAEKPELSATLVPSIPIAALASQTQASLPGFRKSLFKDEAVRAEQPWTAPIEEMLSPDLQQARARMLADVADSRLGTMEQRVAYLLQHFPETRESDIALCIRYWRRFQADVLERWEPLELEVLFELDKLRRSAA